MDWKAWFRQMLPPEHGSWAFVMEPALIAAVLAEKRGALAGLGVFLLFLAYRPAVQGIRDLWRKKRYPRTVPAVFTGLLLGALGLGCMVLTQEPVLIAATFLLGAVFAWLDAALKPRALWRELLGAYLAVPAALVFAPMAGAVLLLARPTVAILSVRGVIARMDDSVACRWVGTTLGLGLGAYAGLTQPLPLSLAYGLVGGRAVWLALTPNRERKVTQVGIVESIVSVLVVFGWLAATPAR